MRKPAAPLLSGGQDAGRSSRTTTGTTPTSTGPRRPSASSPATASASRASGRTTTITPSASGSRPTTRCASWSATTTATTSRSHPRRCRAACCRGAGFSARRRPCPEPSAGPRPPQVPAPGGGTSTVADLPVWRVKPPVMRSAAAAAARERVGERGAPREVRDGEVAERPHAEERAGALALGPAGVVAAGAIAVRDPGVDDQQLRRRRQRDAPALQAPRVDQERPPLDAEARRHLVHHPDARADELVLGPLAEERPPDVVEREAKGRAQRAQHRDLERGAGGEARPDRHAGRDAEVEAEDQRAVGPQRPREPLHVVEPAAAGRLRTERVLLHLARQARARRAHLLVGARRELGHRALRDRHREHEALVVVRVLADQVDPTRRVGRDGRGPAEERREAHATSAGFQYSRQRRMRPPCTSATLIPHHSTRRPPSRRSSAMRHSASTTSPTTAMCVKSKASGRERTKAWRTKRAKAARPRSGPTCSGDW